MIRLPALPYAYNALEPWISSRALAQHHLGNHCAYVRTVNELLPRAWPDDPGLQDMDLPTLMRVLAARNLERQRRGGADWRVLEVWGDQDRLLHAARQAFNHCLFWHSMSPTPSPPTGALARAIDSLGGLARLYEEMRDYALSVPGSGWVWVWIQARADAEAHNRQLDEHGEIDRVGPMVELLPDAQNPGPEDRPLLALDMWEHAFIYDYPTVCQPSHGPGKAGYVDGFLEHLVDWRLACRIYEEDEVPAEIFQ